MLLESAADLNDKRDRPFRTPITNEILDFEVLKSFERIKSDDGSNIVIELIDLYLNTTPQRIQDIRNAVADKKWLLLKRVAHTLKGSSSTLGLHRIARVCRQLEASNMNSRSLDGLVESLESELTQAREVLIVERERRVKSDRQTARMHLAV